MTNLEKILLTYARPYLTEAELKTLLNGTSNSRYSKIKRMLAQGKLLHVRRGLYCITEKLGFSKKPHSFELAQFIYGPSYISLESALSYYHLIPEAVYTITSVAGKRAKNFKTPLGVFDYQTVPLENLYSEVKLVQENGRLFLIAKPWKAICDYVFCYRKNWNNIDPLIKDLRINFENFPVLTNKEIQSLDDYYHQVRITHFLKGIRKDLNRLGKINEVQ